MHESARRKALHRGVPMFHCAACYNHRMSAVLLSLVSLLSTAVGGLFALRFHQRLHFILAFSAGVLLGVVSFDLLPEIFHLAEEQGLDASAAMVALLGGFLLFHGMEKFALVHPAHEDDYAAHQHPRLGLMSAVAMVGHSFMDGVGIGLSFQISTAVGLTVALAVIAHDFCDGLNTVSLMLMHGNSRRHALLLLAADAAAPVLGAASTLAFHLPPASLMLYLGFFAGFLLYIAAADILPEAHSRARPGAALGLIALTCLGAALMYLAVRLAG